MENNETLSLKLKFFQFYQIINRTKVTCREGGCGACIVNSEQFNTQTSQIQFNAINSVRITKYDFNWFKIEILGRITTF